VVGWLAIGAASAEAICVTVKAKEMRPKHWDVVFLGRVSLDRPGSPDVPDWVFGGYNREIHFEVLASWKGVVSRKAIVAVQVGYGEETPNYRTGGEYVVYARSLVTGDGEELLIGPSCVDAFRWCDRFERKYNRVLYRSLGRPEWWIGLDPDDRC